MRLRISKAPLFGMSGVMIALLTLTSSALSAPVPSTQIESTILKDLKKRENQQFSTLIRRWESLYHTDAVKPLIQVAKKKDYPDADRYIAILGVAKIGGQAVAPQLVPLLKDSSWMIRSGTLRALTILDHPETSSYVLKGLNDKALVVRSQAVDAVQALKPKGYEAALVKTLLESNNYHRGQALWVPYKALEVLEGTKTAHSWKLAKNLAPLLDYRKDPKFQEKLIHAFETFTQTTLAQGQPIEARRLAWAERLKRK